MSFFKQILLTHPVDASLDDPLYASRKEGEK